MASCGPQRRRSEARLSLYGAGRAFVFPPAAAGLPDPGEDLRADLRQARKGKAGRRVRCGHRQRLRASVRSPAQLRTGADLRSAPAAQQEAPQIRAHAARTVRTSADYDRRVFILFPLRVNACLWYNMRKPVFITQDYARSEEMQQYDRSSERGPEGLQKKMGKGEPRQDPGAAGKILEQTRRSRRSRAARGRAGSTGRSNLKGGFHNGEKRNSRKQ